jgi:hypothetical protein
MVMPYNVTEGVGNISSITSLFDMFKWLNTASNNWFGYMIIVSVFVISFIISNRFETIDAFRTASYGAFLVSILLSLVGLVDALAVVIPLILVGISVVLKK